MTKAPDPVRVFFPGESMWCEPEEDGPDSGHGKLVNNPVCNDELEWGAIVHWTRDSDGHRNYTWSIPQCESHS